MPDSEPKPKLIELVGGGAGQGWKAVLRNGKPAVVHEIPVPQAEATAAVPRLQRLFERRHPALSPVLAWGTDVNGIWVAVEPNEGTPLSSILGRGPLTPPAAAALGAAVLSGVAALHETGIAMGGFGATAVRVTPNGEVRLAGHPAAAARGAPSQSDLRADVRSCGMAVCAAFGVDPAGSPAPPSIPPGLVVTMRSMASGAMGPSADRAQGALREMAAPLLAPDRQMAAQSELATRAGGREVPAIPSFLPATAPAAEAPAPPAPYIAPPRREETPVRTPVSYEAPDRPLQTYPSAPAPTFPPVPPPPPVIPPAAAASAAIEPPPGVPAVPTWSEAPPRSSAETGAPSVNSTNPPPVPAPPAPQPSWLVERPAEEAAPPRPMPAFEPIAPAESFATSPAPQPAPPPPATTARETPSFSTAPPEAPASPAFTTAPPPPAASTPTNPPAPAFEPIAPAPAFSTAPPPASAPTAPPSGGSTWAPVEAPVWKPGEVVPTEPLGAGYSAAAPTLDQPKAPTPLRPPTSPPVPRQTAPRPARYSEPPPERPGWLVPAAVVAVVVILLGIFGVVVLPRLTGGKNNVAGVTSPSTHPSSKPSASSSPTSGGGLQTVPTYGPASAAPISKVQICTTDDPCTIPGASPETGSACDLNSCKLEVAIYFTAVQKSVQVAYTLKFFDRCTGQTTDLPGPKPTTTPSTGYIVAIPTDHLSVNIPGGVKSAALVAVTDQPGVAASAPLLLGSGSC